MGMAFGLGDRDLGIQRLFVPPVRMAAVEGRASHA
jgi:hypothetical protein